MQLLSGANKSTAAPDHSSENCAHYVLNVVPPVVRTMRRFMRGHRLRGLSVPQFRAMGLLNFSPKASLSMVADHIGASLPAASRMIDAMVVRKLVVRQVCSRDRRQISLHLTARGQNAFRDSRRAAKRQLAEQLATLTAPQQNSVIKAMKILANIFGSDADHPGAAPDRET